MALSLQCISGGLKGQTFPIRHGLTLGRKADILLNDQKASSVHARITQLEDGTYAIIDNNSKNGIKIDGISLPSSPLLPGLKIMIGDHEFSVVGSAPAPAPPQPVQKAPPPVPKAKFWNEILSQFAEDNQDEIVNARKGLTPLSPALVLEFQLGPQMNTRWVVGYGPRKIGAQCLDLPIYEPGAPEVCFEIIPTPQGIVFKTSHSDVVLLNGKNVDNETLRVGDSIRISETVIEVDFTE